MRKLTSDEVDDVLASAPARSNRERGRKQAADDRIVQRETAKREDRLRDETLESLRATRDAANARIDRYDAAIDDVVRVLGRDHEASRILLAAQQS